MCVRVRAARKTTGTAWHVCARFPSFRDYFTPVLPFPPHQRRRIDKTVGRARTHTHTGRLAWQWNIEAHLSARERRNTKRRAREEETRTRPGAAHARRHNCRARRHAHTTRCFFAGFRISSLCGAFENRIVSLYRRLINRSPYHSLPSRKWSRRARFSPVARIMTWSCDARDA